MSKKIAPSLPRMSYSQIKDIVSSLGRAEAYCMKDSGSWVLIFQLKSEEGKYKVIMSSQRQDVRTFKTLDAARKACDFVNGMSVVGI